VYYLKYVRLILVSLFKQVNKGPLMNSCKQFHIQLQMTKCFIHFITFKIFFIYFYISKFIFFSAQLSTIYSTLKNFQQFFYMQETNILSNCFIQFYFLIKGQ